MTPTIGNRLEGYAGVVGAAAAWGTSGIFVKFVVANSGISSLSLAFWRDLVTALTLLAGLLIVRPQSLRVRRSDLPRLLGLGASIGAFHLVWNLAVLLHGAAVATVQQSTMPAITVLAAWILWRERLSWAKAVSVVGCFIGIVLVTGPAQLAGTHLSFAGWVVTLALPLCYASWSLFVKSVRNRYDPVTTLAYGFGFGALTLLPFQVLVPLPFPVPLAALPWFAGLIVQTIVAFAAYAFGIGRLPAGVASVVAMSEILFVTFYAGMWLNEHLVPVQVLGVAVVVGSVLLILLRGEQSPGDPNVAPVGEVV